MKNIHAMPFLTHDKLAELTGLCQTALLETPVDEEEKLMHLVARTKLRSRVWKITGTIP